MGYNNVVSGNPKPIGILRGYRLSTGPLEIVASQHMQCSLNISHSHSNKNMPILYGILHVMP